MTEEQNNNVEETPVEEAAVEETTTEETATDEQPVPDEKHVVVVKVLTEEASSWKARLRRRRRRTRSSRKRANRELSQNDTEPHDAAGAVKMLKSFKQPAKFNQSVELCMHLGIDPRQADQQLRGAVTMPHGIGKAARVVCFCGEDKVDAVKAAGAVEELFAGAERSRVVVHLMEI